jgi:hypothetical protein
MDQLFIEKKKKQSKEVLLPKIDLELEANVTRKENLTK